MRAVHVDDSDGANQLRVLFGCAFLATLEPVECMDWLKPFWIWARYVSVA